MVIAYWILGVLLAVMYLPSGGMKVVRSKDALSKNLHWVADVPLPVTRTIGTLEILGAIGLILPPLTHIAPALAFAAAIGFVLVQVGALVLHLKRGETQVVGINIGLLVIAAVEVWLATHWL